MPISSTPKAEKPALLTSESALIDDASGQDGIHVHNRKKQTETGMYNYVTVAKAIGILLVVVGHFTSTRYMPAEYIGLKNWIFSFHMPLFMILSGFLFRNTLIGKEGKLPFAPFVKKKFMRLMVPYFFISFCIALLNIMLGQFFPMKGTVNWTYLGEIFYKNVGGSAVFLWFIYSLFIISVVAALFSKLKNGMVWMGLLSGLLYFIPLPAVFYLSSVQRYLLYFWCGIFLFDLVNKKMLKLSVWEFLLMTVLLSSIYYLYGVSGYEDWLHSIIALGYGITGSYAVICLSHMLSGINCRITNVLILLGAYSAYIYLLHMVGVYAIRLVFEKMGIFTPSVYFTALFLGTMAGVFLPVLLTKRIIYRSKYLTLLMGGK